MACRVIDEGLTDSAGVAPKVYMSEKGEKHRCT